MLLYPVTGIWIQLKFELSLIYQLLGYVWFITVLHTEQIDLFPCFCVISLTFIIIISHPNNSCWPPHQTRNFLMPIFFYLISLFLSLFLSLLHANRIFFFCRITIISREFCIVTEQNNYIFMYVQWKWIHTAYIFMEETFKTLTLD